MVTVGIDLSGRVGDSVQIGNTLNSTVWGKYSAKPIAVCLNCVDILDYGDHIPGLET